MKPIAELGVVERSRAGLRLGMLALQFEQYGSKQKVIRHAGTERSLSHRAHKTWRLATLKYPAEPAMQFCVVMWGVHHRQYTSPVMLPLGNLRRREWQWHRYSQKTTGGPVWGIAGTGVCGDEPNGQYIARGRERADAWPYRQE